MKYSIVIITKDRLPHLRRLIGSINTHTSDYELIIVDDVSEDGTREWLWDKKAILGQYTGCKGYQGVSYTTSVPVATAWNLGCELAKGDFIQILNDDMEVTERWLENQVEVYDQITAEGTRVGTLASKLLRGDEILSRGGAFRGIHLVPVPGPEEVKQVDYSNTPFFKKEVWKDVGGFDTYDWIYYEDVGFALKLQEKGYKNYYNPNSVLKHETLGLLPEHGKEQFERRQFNENILQKKAREKFMERWKEYLLSDHINLY